MSSTYGSGSFGVWTTGALGLPAYRYTLDEAAAPQAAQPELAGSRDAWHQLGNDHIVADAFNHGYTQLWSQDRTYEWMNKADPAHDHFVGGYGYLRLAGRTYSHALQRPGARGEHQPHLRHRLRRAHDDPARRARRRAACTRRSATTRCCCTT